MFTIKLSGLGLTVDNLPVEMFQYVSSPPSQVGNDLTIMIEDHNLDTVHNIIHRHLNGEYNRNRIGNSIYNYTGPGTPTPEATVEHAPQPVQGELTTPAPAEVEEGTVEIPLEEEVAPENGEGELLYHDEYDDDDDECFAEAHPYDITALENAKIEGDQLNEMIGSLIGGDTTRIAGLLRQKNETFNRKWQELINLKQEIEKISMELKENPLFSTLTTQAQELVEADNAIDNVYFVDKKVVVITKELTTPQEVFGHKRKIGRMAIIINVSGFLGSPERQNGLIEVRNLDRQFKNEGDYWQCGHVHNGTSICFGNAWELLFQAFVSRDLPTVVEVLLRFIQSPNEADHWSYCMKHFPVAEEG